jgi:hypothetical protein
MLINPTDAQKRKQKTDQLLLLLLLFFCPGRFVLFRVTREEEKNTNR